MLYESGLLPAALSLDMFKRNCQLIAIVEPDRTLPGFAGITPRVFIKPQVAPIHYDYVHAAWEPDSYWTDDDGGLEYAEDHVKVNGVWLRPAIVEEDFPRCDWCEQHKPALGPAIVYDSPWDENPRSPFNVCADCYDQKAWTDSSWTDFHYEWCEWCERDIIVRNPRNGWHSFFKYIGSDGEFPIRLSCYERDLKENGQDREDFEDRKGKPRTSIRGGMFLVESKWLSDGWEIAEDMPGFIGCGDDAQRYNEAVIKLLDRGHKVVTQYEALAIGGLEGSVSTLIKKTGESNDE